MALMWLLFSLRKVDIIFEASAFRAWIMVSFFLQFLLSCLFTVFIFNIFAMCVS